MAERRLLTYTERAIYRQAVIEAQAVGSRLYALRTAANISQAEMGTFLEIHQSAVSRVEGGGQMLTPAQLLALSKLFQVPLDHLLGGMPLPQVDPAPPKSASQTSGPEKPESSGPEGQKRRDPSRVQAGLSRAGGQSSARESLKRGRG